MFSIDCQTCHRRNEVPLKYAGKRLKCPGCGGPMDVPVSQGAPALPPANAGAANRTAARQPTRAGHVPARQPHAIPSRQDGGVPINPTAQPIAPPMSGQPSSAFPPISQQAGGSPSRRVSSRRRPPVPGSRFAIVATVVSLLIIGGIVALVFVVISQSERQDDYMTYVKNKERVAREKKEKRYKEYTDRFERHTRDLGASPSYGGAGDTVEIAGMKSSISGKRKEVPSLSHSSVYDDKKDETTVLTSEVPVDIRLGNRQIIVQLGYIHPGQTMASRRDVKGVMLISGDADDLADQSATLKLDGQSLLLRNSGKRAGKIAFDLSKQQMRELAQSAEIHVEFGRVSFSLANEHHRLLEQIRVLN